MALPGSKKDNIKAKPSKKDEKGKVADGEEEEVVVDEFSFAQMKEMGAELKGLRESHAKEQLEKIKKQKAEEKKKKKKKKDDADTRIDVKELVTETEARKGGLPDHIAALPKNHPIRVRWEKGFRQREDGTWYQLSDDELRDDIGISEEKQRAFLLIPLVVLGIMLIIGGNWYENKLTETRKEIIYTIKLKNIKDKPETKAKLKKAYKSHWLPELTALLEHFKKIKRNFDAFSDNEEAGSYIQHIKKHNKKFDAEEAMEWRTRVIRKPSN
ncbi:MAG: hypothetical protein HQL69_19060 [Magnetococcales bacterium]|nr:hypothetical protein [Magnetococcales bacterium]